MSSNTSNRNTKNMEEIQAAMQALIAQGRKEGMLQASDLNAQLEKLQLSPEKIEEIPNETIEKKGKSNIIFPWYCRKAATVCNSVNLQENWA